MMKPVTYIEIVESNGTYLVEGSVLPVYLDSEGGLFAVEEYEKFNPCEQPLNDLISDGIVFKFVGN